MNSPISERLYNLLPAIYRLRDSSQPDEPLRTLLAVIEQELQLLEADIDGLYENWFIETCELWVMPYIADLLGIQGLNDEKHLFFSQRSQIANAVRYRRRKGTLATLERIIQDVTGWKARVVEFSENLAMTQHVQHVRPGKGGTFNLHNAKAFVTPDSPFDTTARTADIRSFSFNRGKYNLPNIGIFLWRLQSYPVKCSTAFEIPEGKGRYTFHPLGYDMPLFNYPQTRTELTQVTEEINWPEAIKREAFQADLEEYQKPCIAEQVMIFALYIALQGKFHKLASLLLHYYQKQFPKANISNLNRKPERNLNVIQWREPNLPPSNTQYYYGPERSLNIIKNGESISPHQIISADLDKWSSPPKGKVAVDLRLGRLMFAEGEEPEGEVRVSYSYGFSADIGGGPYNRRQTLTEAGEHVWYVSKSYSLDGWFNKLSDALDKWRNNGKQGIIRIMDNSAYHERIDITLDGQQWLAMEAADGACPSIHPEGGNLMLESNSLAASVKLNGLLIGGGIKVKDVKRNLSLQLTHCTLMPTTKQDSISVAVEKSDNLYVRIAYSIVDSLSLPAEGVTLRVCDSIVDARGTDRYAIASCRSDQSANNPPNYGPPTTLERTTIFGRVKVQELTLASETIFIAPVEVERGQISTIRFSYCIPAEEKLQFTSTQYGQPGYAQLSTDCATNIRQEAENNSEMGVFNHLLQPQRRANLDACLREYLSFELKPIISYIT
jgi:hypothetical protein